MSDQGKPAKMKALSGAGAEPRRHLDYLIYQPERSVLLHGGGVSVARGGSARVDGALRPDDRRGAEIRRVEYP